MNMLKYYLDKFHYNNFFKSILKIVRKCFNILFVFKDNIIIDNNNRQESIIIVKSI